MKPEQFVAFLESLYNADDTSGRAGPSKTYMRAIYIGYEYPNLGPPKDDDCATDGYKFGLELRKRLK